MPAQLIPDPAGVNGLQPSAVGTTIEAVNGDSVALPIGTLVEIIVPFNPPTSPPYSGAPAATPFQVKRSATTADFYLLGVVSGIVPTTGPATQTSTAQNSVPVGGIAEITVEGPAQILCDDTGGATTEGDPLIQSSTTDGHAKTNTTTAVLGKTIGTALQTVTIGSGSALVWAYIHKV